MPPSIPSSEHQPTKNHSGRRIPGRYVLGSIAIILAAAGTAIFLRHDRLDPAVRMYLQRSALAISALILLVWFVFVSGYSHRIRRFIGWGSLVTVLACLALLRIERTSGKLQLEFAWRWAPHRDELLDSTISRRPPQFVDLATTSLHDFPEFLGRHRNSQVSGISLDPDWSGRPPKVLWKQPIGAGWSGFSAVNRSAVTLEQRGALELVTCYDVETGKLNWSQAVKARHATTLGYVGPRSTPTIHEGRVYTLGATGILSCWNGSDGTLVWRRDLLPEHQITIDESEQAIPWGRAASPLVYDDLVVVPLGGQPSGPKIGLIAVDRQEGTTRWTAGNHQAAYASPMLATMGGVQQIVMVNEDFVSAHEPSTGMELWSHPWPGKSYAAANVSQPVAVDDSHLFLSKGYGEGAELIEVQQDAGQWTTRSIWKNHKVMKTKFSNVALRNGFAYGLDDGILNCVDVRTGERRWKKGRFGFGQNLLVNELLLVLGERGELALVQANPHRFQELGRIQALDGQTWNTLCLIGDKLLIRNSEMAACYQLATISSD